MRQLPVHFIKAWRIFRWVTVEQLAELAGMSTGNLSALENRRRGYSSEGLERIAAALRTTTGALLTVNPLDETTGDFWTLWERSSPASRETLRLMAERLIDSHSKR